MRMLCRRSASLMRMTRDVLGHRDDHLPVVLGLRLLARLELDPRQLRDALDEVARSPRRTRRAPRRARRRCPRRRRGGARRRSSPRRAAARRRSCADAERVVDEVLARAALLALVRARGEVEGAAEQLAVDVRVVALDLRDQLVDEALYRSSSSTTAMSLSVLRPRSGTFPRRIRLASPETGAMTRWIRARSRRRLRKTAQVLVALETLALERQMLARDARASLSRYCVRVRNRRTSTLELMQDATACARSSTQYRHLGAQAASRPRTRTIRMRRSGSAPVHDAYEVLERPRPRRQRHDAGARSRVGVVPPGGVPDRSRPRPRRADVGPRLPRATPYSHRAGPAHAAPRRKAAARCSSRTVVRSRRSTRCSSSLRARSPRSRRVGPARLRGDRRRARCRALPGQRALRAVSRS